MPTEDMPIIHCAWPDAGEPVDNGPLHTLQETAEHFGMSVDRVRTIEQIALRKLRHNPDIIEMARSRRLCHA